MVRNIVLLTANNISRRFNPKTHVKSNIKYITYDYANIASLHELITLIDNSLRSSYTIHRLGIMYHNEHDNTIKLFNKDKQRDINLFDDFNDFICFVYALKSKYGIQQFDIISSYVSCQYNILSPYIYEKTGVNVNMSSGDIGKRGNWVLENGNVPLSGLYFYSFVKKLDVDLGSQSQPDEVNKLEDNIGEVCRIGCVDQNKWNEIRDWYKEVNKNKG